MMPELRNCDPASEDCPNCWGVLEWSLRARKSCRLLIVWWGERRISLNFLMECEKGTEDRIRVGVDDEE